MVVKKALVAASQTGVVHATANATLLTKSVSRRFVAGDTEADAVQSAADLAAAGLHCSIEYLGPEVTDVDGVAEVVRANRRLLVALAAADLTDRTELSVKLSDLGLSLEDGRTMATDAARAIADAAAEFDVHITVDMEEYATVDATLEVVSELRRTVPATGAVIQSYLKRSEADSDALATPDSRVRLVKGAFSESAEVAYQSAQDIDLSYVRCLKALMSGAGTPLIATHDPRLIDIAAALAVRTSRDRHSYEFQMLYGVRTAEQTRLAAGGEKVRVFVPYGPNWYGYLVRRMAEKPANLALFARALTGR